MKSHEKNIKRITVANLIMFSGLALLFLPRMEINVLQQVIGLLNQAAIMTSFIQTLILL